MAVVADGPAEASQVARSRADIVGRLGTEGRGVSFAA